MSEPNRYASPPATEQFSDASEEEVVIFPLSFAQRRLWFLYQLDPQSAAYNMPFALRLTGELDVAALERTLNEIVRRHEVLRTTFETLEEEPVQLIAGTPQLELPLKDLSGLPSQEREAEAQRLSLADALRPFDFARGPMLRASLLRLGAEEHVLSLTMHHIVSDGWSMGVLVREVAALYTAYAAGQASPLAELPIQYADYAEWQRGWLEGEVLAEQLGYWKRQLAGAAPVLELPTDRVRPAVQSFKGATEPLFIPAEVSESLKALSRREGVTMFMLLLAAWQVLLSRYTGADEVIVGAPVAGRNRAEVEELIGFFVNTLVLRTDLSGNPRFREALKRVHDVVVGAFAHQDVPFEKLVEELQPERSLSHTPLFQVMFSLQNAPAADEELPGLSLSAVDVEAGTAKTDLALTLVETDRGILGSLSYATDLFDGSTIRGMLSHFGRLLESVTADADARVWDLALMTPTEEGRILSQCCEEARIPERDECMHRMFESQVNQAPDALALIFEDERVTYGKLNVRANQLAHYLRSLGVVQEVLVGILLENSVEMIVALLGVLKAGAAYVPLDPEYPEQRLLLMLKDARVPLLITQRRLMSKLPGLEARAIYLDDERELIARQSVENPSPVATPGSLAYLIYTSGSTGTPKGVMIEHRGLSNLVAVLAGDFGIRAESRILQFASFSFDASVLEVHTALSSGATLCLGKKETLMPGESLSRVLREQGITNVLLPPSALAVMPAEELPQLQTLISGGEACSADIVRRWSPGRRFLNAYGPTEITVCATFSECLDGEKTPTIGRAIGGTEAYVLDRQLRPVPVGALGEIYIGGVGVARGYLNLPELTAEKFVPHPFSRQAGGRLYRTGDRARLLPGGEIDYQGRIDEQLKVRGFRIEPGEIENALMQNSSVHEALVVAREDAPGDKRLVAYVVKRQEGSTTINELRDSLKERLPEYMIPSAFVFLEELPLTPQNKYDRRKLPAPQQARPEESRIIAPRNLLELQLTEQWEELLRVPVGVTDDFFEMGGHSLLAVRLMSRIEQLYGRKIPLAALFKAPIYGLQARGLDDEQEPQTQVEAMAGDYLEAVRAVQPHGPYLLGGWSIGGLIALEMARQLQARGEEVRLLALLDTKAPNAEAETEMIDEPFLPASFALHLGLSPEQIHDLADALSEAQPEDYLSFMLERAKATNIIPHDMSLAHLRQQYRVFNANINAARSYRPANRSVSVALFRAEERPSNTQTDATLGWSRLGVEHIEVYDTPGSHLTIMQEPYVSVLAERLAECIMHAQSV